MSKSPTGTEMSAPVSGDVWVSRETDTHIEVTTRYRLWAAIPPEDRGTIEDVKHNYARYPNSREIDKWRGILAHPQCIVALKHPEFRGKWLPCARETAAGMSVCKRHGGQSIRPAPGARANLLAEIERLRQQLAAAQSGGAT